MRAVSVGALALSLAACGSGSGGSVTTITAVTTSVATTETTATVPENTTTTSPTTTSFDFSKQVLHNVEDLSGASWYPADLFVTVQDMTPWDGGTGWGGLHQMFVGATQPGDWIEFIVPVIVSGRYDLEMWLTRAPDFGIVRLSLDGQDLTDVDLYFAEVLPTRGIDLGEHDLAMGEHTVRVTVLGKSPLSTGFKFGVDVISLYGPA